MQALGHVPARCPHCGFRALVRDRDTDAWTSRNRVLVCLLCARRWLVGPEQPVRTAPAVEDLEVLLA